ncbi:Probable acid phosphatase [Sparassis crispa]|uniref:Probable acid phosphatase n=1 Tax=Sparassis crispa TaxID=139825 RepID=A0A401GZ14_9APHY|nr:Probable acid phosphatase [Sparassis crispa]GBE87416.1 Probable acid phosphatase [Sparassis crispa]
MRSEDSAWQNASASFNTETSGIGHVPLDVDGYAIAPPELELQQVHIYMRHGERTPVRVRMAEPPASIPEHWLFCNAAHQFRAAVASGSNQTPELPRVAGQEGGETDETLQTRRVVERGDGTVVMGECLLGELTDIGRQSTYNYGRALRQLYVNRLSFLPDIAKSNDEAYFRSTNVPRTIESLQHVMHGLYPASKSSNDFVPQIKIRNAKEENLFGNTNACKRLEVLIVSYAKAAATAWNTSLEPLDKKISKYINGNPIRLDGQPRASGVLDTINACAAHGIPYPPEFKENGVKDLIEKAVVHEWFAADKSEEVRRLGMGPLLSDMTGKMRTKAERGAQDPLKILVHSTHDTCLAALCNTLDVYDEKWPAFSSALTFELFRRRESVTKQSQPQPPTSTWQNVLGLFHRPQPENEHYVRVRYQNKDLALPLCAQDGKHLPGSPEFCTFAAFRERVRELTPTNWESECAVPSARSS